ncbi:hypothetical protein, partial [Streptococcus salivarius]|uniref:hypothetical protein n=1 Tax=Streptococcus salivarius TaxID=1304 RepID=UPI0011511443
MNEYKQKNNESKGHLCHFDSLLVSKSFSISILRIREERERQGLTREQVCDTEEELTVKQLM